LNDQIATKIHEMFPGLQSLYALQTIAARIGSRLSSRRQFFNPQNHSNNNNNNRRPPPKGKPKFNIHSSLSKEEKDRRRKENLCMYCGSSEHSLNNGPLRNKFKSSSSNVHIGNPEPTTIPRPRISDLPNVKLPIYEFTIKVNNSKTKNKILLDSGSQLNLIDVYFVKEYNIPYSTQSDFPRVSGIGGKQQILGKTLPVSIQYENHICKIQFYVVDFPSYCAILGTEWLFTHNPTIDFTSNKFFLNQVIVLLTVLLFHHLLLLLFVLKNITQIRMKNIIKQIIIFNKYYLQNFFHSKMYLTKNLLMNYLLIVLMIARLNLNKRKNFIMVQFIP